MVIQVDQELCAGCGVCVDACSVGAIQLVDYRAVIDDALCTQCEACTDACPNSAIIALSIPAHAISMASPASESRSSPARLPAAQPVTLTSGHKLASLTGTALAYLGQEVLPYILDGLAATLERRLASQPAKISTIPSHLAVSLGRARSNRTGQMQRRRRSRKGRTK